MSRSYGSFINWTYIAPLTHQDYAAQWRDSIAELELKWKNCALVQGYIHPSLMHSFRVNPLVTVRKLS